MASESGDLERTFDLLWNRQDAPSRGPKPSLNRDRIVAAAIEIADADGLSAVTMRRVAEKFGVTTMALYRYVPSKDDLLELMVDAIAYPPPDPADMPEHWRDALHWWAREQLAVFRRHRWLNDYSFSHPPIGPNNIRWMECAVQALLRSGLPPAECIAVLMIVTNYSLAESRQQHSLLRAEATTGVAYEDVGRVYGEILHKIVSDGAFPGLAEVMAAGGFGGEGADAYGPDEDFEYGLTFILDGIEALVDVRRNDHVSEASTDDPR